MQDIINERLTAPMDIKAEILGFFMVKKIITTNESKGKNGIIQLYGNIKFNFSLPFHYVHSIHFHTLMLSVDQDDNCQTNRRLSCRNSYDENCKDLSDYCLRINKPGKSDEIYIHRIKQKLNRH